MEGSVDNIQNDVKYCNLISKRSLLRPSLCRTLAIASCTPSKDISRVLKVLFKFHFIYGCFQKFLSKSIICISKSVFLKPVPKNGFRNVFQALQKFYS